MATTAVRPAGSAGTAAPRRLGRAAEFALYYAAGTLFGIALAKSGAVSWFKLQEMFRLQGFHLLGVFVTAIATAFVGLQIVKRTGARALTGDAITLPPKELGRGYRYWLGGPIFGAGLAIAGACPGPLYALVGGGATVMVVALASALAGTWAYGRLRSRLPHY